MSVARARAMRKQMSFAEAAMWNLLRQPPLRDLHFRRQVPLGSYYADFASHVVRLVIEVDGEHHTSDVGIVHDARRTTFIASQGYRVVRFWAPDVMRKAPAVFDCIVAECDIEVAASPHPPPIGGPPSP